MFTTQYTGKCAGCGETFPPGTAARYMPNPSGGVDVIVMDCCEEPAESNGADFDSFNRGRAPGIAVLPRGKTGRDKCNRCFMVHSPGQSGCE